MNTVMRPQNVRTVYNCNVSAVQHTFRAHCVPRVCHDFMFCFMLGYKHMV